MHAGIAGTQEDALLKILTIAFSLALLGSAQAGERSNLDRLIPQRMAQATCDKGSCHKNCDIGNTGCNAAGKGSLVCTSQYNSCMNSCERCK